MSEEELHPYFRLDYGMLHVVLNNNSVDCLECQVLFKTIFYKVFTPTLRDHLGRQSGSAADHFLFVFCRYIKRYWKKPFFDVLDKLKANLDRIYGEGKVSLVDAAIRWMYHHSQMDGAHGDAVIIGASSVKHLDENLKSTKHGPLHEGWS